MASQFLGCLIVVMAVSFVAQTGAMNQKFLHAHNISGRVHQKADVNASVANRAEETQNMDAEGANSDANGDVSAELDAADSNTESEIGQAANEESGSSDAESAPVEDEAREGERVEMEDESSDQSADGETQSDEYDDELNDDAANAKAAMVQSSSKDIDDAGDSDSADETDGVEESDDTGARREDDAFEDGAILRKLHRVHGKIAAGSTNSAEEDLESDHMEDADAEILKTLHDVHRKVSGATANAEDGETSALEETSAFEKLGDVAKLMKRQKFASEDGSGDTDDDESHEMGSQDTLSGASEESDEAEVQTAGTDDDSETGEAESEDAVPQSDATEADDADKDMDEEADDTMKDYRYEATDLIQASGTGVGNSDDDQDTSILTNLDRARRKIAGESVEQASQEEDQYRQGSEIDDGDTAILREMDNLHHLLRRTFKQRGSRTASTDTDDVLPELVQASSKGAGDVNAEEPAERFTQ